ncbi:MAG: XdhC family protein, partial [Lachnospiraceae bacterium]|nr:XdhC family protein [Lachnospiraceae bacterium]
MKVYEEIQNYLKDTTTSVLFTEWDTDGSGEIKNLEQRVEVRNPLEPQSEQEEKMFAVGRPVVNAEDGHMTVAEPFYPEDRLIILGGGHVALPLVEFGAKAGFSVTVVDDRLSFANPGRFPWADHVICDSFEHAIKSLNIRRQDYVCILTRGHRWDADCLRAILSGEEPGYLGMIGSRRRVA